MILQFCCIFWQTILLFLIYAMLHFQPAVPFGVKLCRFLKSLTKYCIVGFSLSCSRQPPMLEMCQVALDNQLVKVHLSACSDHQHTKFLLVELIAHGRISPTVDMVMYVTCNANSLYYKLHSFLRLFVKKTIAKKPLAPRESTQSRHRQEYFEARVGPSLVIRLT